MACLAAGVSAQQAPWQVPARFARPELAGEEGGLWSLMDRQEQQLRRSPFLLRDAGLRAHVQDMACRLAGEHCPDIRVYLVQTPEFNASMAPNGMMQVWTGLLLRMENEAQLAAVLGHEIGHFLERHSLERLRDAKSRSAVAQFLGLFGLVGAIGQLATLAGAFAYSREQESVADEIGARLMQRAGYDAAEAGRVWDNLLQELLARPGGDPTASALFASHPPATDRRDALQRIAQAAPGGESRAQAWRARVRPHLADWLGEEVKRNRPEESLAMLGRMIERTPDAPEYVWARGEVYRLRAKEGDHDAALAEYRRAAAMGGEPAATHRGMGLVLRLRSEAEEAGAAFRRYLAAAPDAPDAALIKHYLGESGK